MEREQSTLTWEDAKAGAGRFAAGARRDRTWRGRAVRIFAVLFLALLALSLLSFLWRGDGSGRVNEVSDAVSGLSYQQVDTMLRSAPAKPDELVVDGVEPVSLGNLNGVIHVRWWFVGEDERECVEAIWRRGGERRTTSCT